MAMFNWAVGDRITAARLRGDAYDLWKGVAGATDTLAPASGTTIDLSALAVASGLRLPQAAGARPTTRGVLAHDTTDDVMALGDSTLTRLIPYVRLSGDLPYGGTSGVPARLAIGTSRQMLITSTATLPAWVASPQSLMTATGDLLYASAANTLARRAIGPAGQYLSSSGGVPVWAALAALTPQNRVVAAVTINNTTVETDIFNYVLPANTLTSTNSLWLNVFGDALQNQTCAAGWTFRLYLGSTTIATVGETGLAQSASRRIASAQAFVSARGNTCSQVGYLTYYRGVAGTAASTNGSDTGGSGGATSAIGFGIAEDATTSQTLRLSVQLTLASASLEYVMRAAQLVLI